MLEYGDHVVHAADMSTLRTRTVQVSTPAIDPVWNTARPMTCTIDIAERGGFLFGEGGLNDYISQTLALCDEHKLDLHSEVLHSEIIDRLTRCHYGEEYGLVVFRRARAYPRASVQGSELHFYYFPWGKTRHPLYFNQFYANGQALKKNLAGVGLDVPPGWDVEEFWKHWEPIPQWVGRCDVEFADEFDLRAMVWTTPQTRMCSATRLRIPGCVSPLRPSIPTTTDPHQHRGPPAEGFARR